MISKFTSLFMAIFFIGTIFITDGAKDAMQIGIGMIFILALIWFGDAMGDYTGPTGHGAITASTPGCMLRGFGWLVMIVAFLASILQLIAFIKN